MSSFDCSLESSEDPNHRLLYFRVRGINARFASAPVNWSLALKLSFSMFEYQEQV